MKRKLLRGALLGACGCAGAGAAGGEPLLRIRRRGFVHEVPRDSEELRCVAWVQPPERGVRRVSRRNHHARSGIPFGKSAAFGEACAAGVQRPGPVGCTGYSAPDGAMPRAATGRSSRSGRSSAHSATYRRLFLDAKHNRQRLLTDDCLRCHGMHFDGGIRDLVAPVDANGPWRLLRPELAEQPAIPCLSCHQVHREGELLPRAVRDAESAKSSTKQELLRPSVQSVRPAGAEAFRGGFIAAAGDAGRGSRGEDQSGYAAGAVLSMPRSAGRGGGGYGRRPYAGGRS